MTTARKAATAECPGCHFRFPKPEMVAVEERVGRQYVPGRKTTKRDSEHHVTGYSEAEGRWTKGRLVTRWFCRPCYAVYRSRKMRWMIVKAIGYVAAFLFILLALGNSS